MNQTYHDLYLKYKRRYIDYGSNINLDDIKKIIEESYNNKNYDNIVKQLKLLKDINQYRLIINNMDIYELLNNIKDELILDTILKNYNYKNITIYDLLDKITDENTINIIFKNYYYNKNNKNITIYDLLNKITDEKIIDIIFRNIDLFKFKLEFNDIYKKYIKKFIINNNNYNKEIYINSREFFIDNREFFINNIDKILELIKDDNQITNILLKLFINFNKYDIFEKYHKLGIKYDIDYYLNEELKKNNLLGIQKIILNYKDNKKIKVDTNDEYYKLLIDNVNNGKYDLNNDIIKNPKKLFNDFENNFDICMIILNKNTDYSKIIDKNLNIINLYKKIKKSENSDDYISKLNKIYYYLNKEIDVFKIIKDTNSIDVFYYFYKNYPRYITDNNLLKEKIRYIIDNNLDYELNIPYKLNIPYELFNDDKNIQKKILEKYFDYYTNKNTYIPDMIELLSDDYFKKLVNETDYYIYLKKKEYIMYLKRCINLNLIEFIIDKIINYNKLDISLSNKKDRLMYTLVIYYREINKFKDTFESWFYSIIKDDKQKLLVKIIYGDKFEKEYKNKIKEYIKDIETKYEKFIKKSFFSLEKNISKDDPLFS